MRLGQLARKLGIQNKDIVEYLDENHNIQIENNLNTKIEKEQIELIELQFKVKEEEKEEEVKTEEVPEDPIAEEITPPKPKVKKAKKAPAAKKTKKKEKEVEVGEIIDLKDKSNVYLALEEDEESKNAEVIKAPKIELDGIKVVGKIDLPPPKSQEEIEAEEEAKRIKREEKEQRQQERLKRKSGKKELSFSEIEKRKKAKEKKLEEERQNREKKEKREHYLNIQKDAVVQKPVNKKFVDRTVFTDEEEEIKKPKSLLGRFWQWFSS